MGLVVYAANIHTKGRSTIAMLSYILTKLGGSEARNSQHVANGLTLLL